MFETRLWDQLRIIIVVPSRDDIKKIYEECPQMEASCQTLFIHVSVSIIEMRPVERISMYSTLR